MDRVGRIAFAGCFGFALALCHATAQADAADNALTGIWAYETTFGAALEGELTLAREDSDWRAVLSGAEVEFRATDDKIRFAFPAGGRFRGALIDDGHIVDSFWLRPAATTDPRYPGGASQDFAAPIALQRVKPATWRGMVRPLEDRFTLYLKIFHGDNGSLIGAFRNPEQHSHGPAMQLRVSRAGGTVSFALPDPARPEILGRATLLHAPDRLRMLWPDLDREIELVRRTPEQAADFFPRAPGGPAYVYRRPTETDDGWETTRAAETGIDEAVLTRVVQNLIDADPAARRAGLVHSLLVARHGKLVLEEYFFGFDRDTPHDLRSAGKTFASVMLGAAMMNGAKIAPETKLYDLLASMGPFANPDARKSRITLAHLMTHTSGLACDDNDDSSPGNEYTMQSQTRQPNWWKYALDLPVAHDPGNRYAYCSANMNLMGAALTTATGTWLPELFERMVARPLDFGPYHWNLMPTNEGYLGGGAWLRPRDFLKLGQAYLDGGVWRGRRIVAESWVTRSTAPRMHISPATTGLDAEQFADAYLEADDGYAWHLGQVHSGARAYRTYAATGNGGQMLIVIPELDMTVAFTGGNYRQGGIWLRWPDNIIGAQIVPAIRD